MKNKRMIIYLSAAIIAAGLYYLDTWQGREKERSEEEAKRLVLMEGAAMDAIIIKKGGVPITLKKTKGADEGDWEITSPVQTEADRFAVESLKNNLARLKYNRLINEEVKDVSPFGLDNPSLSIHYHSGEKSGALSFGDESPTRDGYYASAENSSAVYLVGTNSLKEIDKSLFDLRKKDLFDLSIKGLERFILVRGSERWDLIREDGQWSFMDDKDFKVDSPRVDTLVRRVLIARASSFEEEQPTELDIYGLSSPKAWISLKGKKKVEKLSFGKISKDDESKIYALTGGGIPSRVVTVDKWILTDIPEDREKLRRKTEETEDEKGQSRPLP